MGAIDPRTDDIPLDSLAAMRRSMKSLRQVDGQGSEKLAFGKVLRSFRLQKDLTQEQLGWKARIDRKFISALERGMKEPGLMTLIRITKTLGVSLAEFMTEVEKELELTDKHDHSVLPEHPQPPSIDHSDTPGQELDRRR